MMKSTSPMGYFDVPNVQVETLARVFLVMSLIALPISTAVTNVFMGLTLIAWLAAGGYKGRLAQLRGHWFAYAIVMLFLIICLGATYSSGSQSDILYHLHKYGKLLFILPAITLLQDEKWQERALLGFGAAMLITLAISLITVVWPLSFVPATANGPTNNHFVFKDHIAQNLMMSFFAMILAVKGKFAPDLKRKIIFYGLAALAVIDILFFVAGRTGFLSLALNAIVFIFFLPTAKQKMAGLLAFVVVVALAFQFSANFKGRIALAVNEFETQEQKELTSVGQRIEFLKKSAQLIKEKPVFGFGTGSYAREFCRVAESAEWCAAGRFHPHNQFIALGVQLGALGILGYLILIAAAAKSALQQCGIFRICGAGLIATIVADSVTHAPLFLVTEAQFFTLLFSVFLATANRRPQQDKAKFLA